MSIRTLERHLNHKFNGNTRKPIFLWPFEILKHLNGYYLELILDTPNTAPVLGRVLGEERCEECPFSEKGHVCKGLLIVEFRRQLNRCCCGQKWFRVRIKDSFIKPNRPFYLVRALTF